MTDFAVWPSNVEPAFRDWLMKNGVSPQDWSRYGQSFRSQRRKEWQKAKTEPGTQSAAPVHSEKTGRKWPDNVSADLRRWLTRQGVSIDDWLDKGENYRAEKRADYHKDSPQAGGFHFSPDDTTVLRQAGHSPAEIAQQERKIGENPDPKNRAAAYQQIMEQARIDAAKNQGLLDSGAVDDTGRPINITVAHGGAAPDAKYGIAPVTSAAGGADLALAGPGGDVQQPITQVLSDPFNWESDQVTKLQARLVAIGLLQSGSYIPGKYDAATISAYRQIVENANTSKMTPQEYLDQLPDGSLAQKKEPFTAPAEKRTDDKDIKRVADQTVQAIMGRAATPAEIASITAKVRASEDVEYAGTIRQAKAEYNNQPGGTQVDYAPSVESITYDEFQNTTEAQGYRYAKQGLDLIDMLRGGL